MRFWFVPVWSGDFRLEADGSRCRLTVEDPTEADRKLLTPFLRTAVDLGWTSGSTEVAAAGLTTIPLEVSLAEAGPLLVDQVHADAATWTAVRHESGKVTVLDGNGKTELSRSAGDAAGAASPEPKADPPAAAATVREPMRGCPAPTTAARRASEVLRAFSTASQWRQWTENGRMRIVGRASGMAYWLHHRKLASELGLGHLLVEAASGREICVWDDRVPAEEEALGIKLAVEHRERWLRGWN